MLWIPCRGTAQETVEEVDVEEEVDDSASIAQSINALIEKSSFTETSQLGIAVYDLTDNQTLYEYNAHQTLRPASTQKLLTAITFLDSRGSGYSFKTGVYNTGAIVDSILYGNIYVKGGMDPAVSSNDINNMVQAFHSAGIKRIEGEVYADVSFKDTLKWGAGWCWDDDNPTLSPLLTNRRKDFMALFVSTLLQDSLVTVSEYRKGRVPQDAELLILCEHTAADVLGPMMKKSDNLYAESMLYQLCRQENVSYPSAEKSLAYVEKLAAKLGVNTRKIRIADGCGLSLYNHTTAATEVAFLRYAYRHDDIYKALYPALPIAGVDGTLKKRMTHGTAYNNVHAKTGTLYSVSSLAGYATAKNGHVLCFSIINQGILKSDAGKDFQDKVCQILTR
jgi:D-alanyl-D-alanine carboxypeptidase/D-alanyl-D-alanine-endopeptidase (penicillin-binding protein 4)